MAQADSSIEPLRDVDFLIITSVGFPHANARTNSERVVSS